MKTMMSRQRRGSWWGTGSAWTRTGKQTDVLTTPNTGTGNFLDNALINDISQIFPSLTHMYVAGKVNKVKRMTYSF